MLHPTRASLSTRHHSSTSQSRSVVAYHWPPSVTAAVSVEELFDFSRSHWVDLYAKTARRSFDEELKLYELLDLDAQGEDDVDLDVDDSTGAILHG